MDKTPNGSGISPTKSESTIPNQPNVNDHTDDPRSLEPLDLRAQLERPAVWGLLVVIGIVVLVQIWLLFL